MLEELQEGKGQQDSEFFAQLYTTWFSGVTIHPSS